jgi:hypothetical protein
MAEASGQDGVAAGLAHQAASRAGSAGQWLDSRDPRQVVNEMQSFARRRPAVFLALAAGTGLVAGRLTRGLKDASGDNSPSAPAGVREDTPDRSAPAGGLAPAGGAWEADPAASGGDPLVTDDRAGRQDTL